MARVPTYDNFQVAPSQAPGQRFDATTTPDIAGRQMQEMGAATIRASDAAGRMAMDAQQEANQLRVDDAVNQAKQIAMRLTYDKDVGLVNLKGRQALERPDGKSLPEEYTERYKAELASISQSLGNDIQRKVFSVRADAIGTGLYSHAIQHLTAQSNEWANSVDEGSIKNRQADAMLNFSDPARLNRAINGVVDESGNVVERGIKHYVEDMAKRNGKPPEWAESKANEIVADTHKEIVLRMMDKSPTEALDYLKAHEADLGQNVSSLQRTLRPAVDREQGNLKAEKVFTGSTPVGGDFGSIVNFVLHHEGGYVANDAGKGETNLGINITANPDIDVKNLTPEKAKAIYKERYWNGIGADKLPENMRAIAFDAAVNQGVSTANRLVAKADGDPQKLIDLRREEYARLIEKNPDKFGKYEKAWNARLDQLEAGISGKRSLIGMLAEVNQIEDPEQRNIATTRISQLFRQEEAAKAEAYQADFTKAQDIAFSKPGGWKDIPPEVWGNLKPEDRSKMMVVPKHSDPDTVLLLQENPSLWKAGKIEQYRSLLSESDYVQFHSKGNGPDSKAKILAATIDNEQFKSEMIKAGLEKWLNANKETPEQRAVIDLRAKFENVIDAEQMARGRQLSMDEKNALLTRLIKPVKVQQVRTGSLFGLFDGPSAPKDQRAFQVTNPANIMIPPEHSQRIEADMRRLGIAVTPERIRNAYLSMQEAK